MLTFRPANTPGEGPLLGGISGASRPTPVGRLSKVIATKLPFAFKQAKFARDSNPGASCLKQQGLQGVQCREKRRNRKVGALLREWTMRLSTRRHSCRISWVDS
jgi:hypothetical protein